MAPITDSDNEKFLAGIQTRELPSSGPLILDGRPAIGSSQPMEVPMLVKEVMHRNAQWVTPETTVKDVAVKMRDLDIGSLPVGENDRLIGMVTDRDIALRCCADGADPSTLPARAVMTEGIFWCFEDQDVQEVADLMGTKHIRRLPVLSREKRMVGILSVDDLAAKASHELGGEVIDAAMRH